MEKRIVTGGRELPAHQAQAVITGEPFTLQFFPAPVGMSVREGDAEGVQFGDDGALSFDTPGERLVRFTYGDGSARDLRVLAFEPACLELVPSTAATNRSPRETADVHRRSVLRAYANNPARKCPRTGKASDMINGEIRWADFGV